MSIMESLFDQEEVTRRYGISREVAKAEDIAKKMIKDNIPIDSIEKYTGLTIEHIYSLVGLRSV